MSRDQVHGKAWAAVRILGLGFLVAAWVSGNVRAAQTTPEGFNQYAPGELPLPEAHRVYIGEIEKRALVLNAKAFPAIAQALKEGKDSGLAHFLTADFQGEILDLAQGRLYQTDTLEIRRLSMEEPPTPSRSRVVVQGFVDYLLGVRNQFGDAPKIKFSVMSLSPKDRTQLESGPWHGSCLFEMRGPRKDGSAGEFQAMMDYELTGIADLEDITAKGAFLHSARMSEVQQVIARKPILAEVAKERGIDPDLFQENWKVYPAESRPIVTGGVYLGDINNDRFEDILVTDVLGVFLFRGAASGQFENVAQKMGLPHKQGGIGNAALADFDNDGFVDVLLDHRAYKNMNGLRFQEVSDQTGFRFGSATGFTVGDYDRDGLLDLYVSRYFGMRVPKSSKNSWIDGPGGPGNQLWRNLGNWRFEEVSQKANASAGRRSCFTAAWLDANNDTWPDIYVINEFGGGTLLINQGNGRFANQPLLDDLGDFGSMGMGVADYNNDGWIDVYTANMFSKAGRRVMENLPETSYPKEVMAKMKRFVTGSEMYRNKGNLKFERLGRSLRVHRVGWAYGVGFPDLDNDGFVDVYGTAGFVSVNKEEPDG